MVNDETTERVAHVGGASYELANSVLVSIYDRLERLEIEIGALTMAVNTLVLVDRLPAEELTDKAEQLYGEYLDRARRVREGD